MNIEPVIIREIVERHLDQPSDVAQFTIDWAEAKLEHLQESELSTGTLLRALHYDVGNVIEIMDETMPDFAWFQKLHGWLDRVPKGDTSAADGWPVTL